MALVDLEVFDRVYADEVDREAADEAIATNPVLRLCVGGEERAARARKRLTSRQLGRVRQLLWLHVLAILHAEEPVLVYGPHGRAKLVPRRIAERMHAERQLERAAGVEEARTALGFPTVGFTEEADPFAGIDRGVHPRLVADPEPLSEETIDQIAAELLAEQCSRCGNAEGPGCCAASRAPLATWTCEICKDVHPADHAGMMLFACGGMLCCACERRWPEHQGACVPCADLAATLTAAVDDGDPLFDLTDTPEE